ncbi:MAG: endolytic transglycosylase MltG [Deltaproteobacteria bacterium]|nr:endolytic transglycosylase MltG [Deltaproteobacteria bacterium]
MKWFYGRKKVLLLLLFLFLTGAAFYRYATTPVNPLAAVRTVDIPKGAGFLGITEILNNGGLVQNRPFFWALALVKKANRHIRAGEYELAGAMSPTEILDKLVRGQIKDYPVTLPEDITVSDVAKRLSAFKLINEKEFATLATDRSFLASLDIEADSIEGYLYPNTYRFDRTMTTREIIRILVGQFWKEITPEMRKRAEEIGLTLPQWVTLASIIGKESGNNAEKPLISAVFHNRLEMGMKLQSDPTAIYHLEQIGNPIKTVRKEHLQADTPHNTYKIKGLPPGPIANPGIDSLRAALYPVNADYLYFVAKNDGTHHFSTNLAAHNQAVLKYQINKQKK